MVKAVLHRLHRVQRSIWSIHRLQEEVLESEILKHVGTSSLLRKDELQFIPRSQRKFRPGFRAHADPVKIGRRGFRAVRLNSHLETLGVKGVHKEFVQLQQGLASGTDDKSVRG